MWNYSFVFLHIYAWYAPHFQLLKHSHLFFYFFCQAYCLTEVPSRPCLLSLAKRVSTFDQSLFLTSTAPASNFSSPDVIILLWHDGILQVCSSSGLGSLHTTWDVVDTQCSCSCPLSGSERHTTASHNVLLFHLIFNPCQDIAHRSSLHNMLNHQCNAHDVLRSTA